MAQIVREGTVILEFGDQLIQVGSSPGHSFAVMGLDPFTTTWLKQLLRLRVVPASTGLTNEQSHLVDLLRRHGLIEDTSNPLAKVRLRLVGLDRTGISVALALKRAGARYLDVRGSGIVDRGLTELLPGATPGQDRRSSVLEELGSPSMYLGRQALPDLALSVEQRVLDIHRGAHFLQRDVPHLPIVLDDRSVQVGPLLTPGSGACYLCLEHHRRDIIPSWPQIRRQLETAPPAPVELSLSQVVANFVAHLVAEIARSGTDDGWYRATSWCLSDRGVQTARWEPHPLCGCHEERLFPKSAIRRAHE